MKHALEFKYLGCMSDASGKQDAECCKMVRKRLVEDFRQNKALLWRKMNKLRKGKETLLSWVMNRAALGGLGAVWSHLFLLKIIANIYLGKIKTCIYKSGEDVWYSGSECCIYAWWRQLSGSMKGVSAVWETGNIK